MKTLVVKSSQVKGYHIFKVRPHPEVAMEVKLEENNSYDPTAMMVLMPTLEYIPSELHNLVTREENKGEKKQCVSDIAGQQVGRVPANLCKLFRKVIGDADVIKIKCYAESAPTISKQPPSQQSYKRNVRGKDRRGGGAVIPCRYVLFCYETSFNKVKLYLEHSIKDLDHATECVEAVETESVASCPW